MELRELSDQQWWCPKCWHSPCTCGWKSKNHELADALSARWVVVQNTEIHTLE